MGSQLESLKSVKIQDELVPSPELLNNIPLLHTFLKEIMSDWKRAAAPWQERIDHAQGTPDYTAASCLAFSELQPAYLKCLFSYIFFFEAAIEAYKAVYSEMNRCIGNSGLQVPHGKPPNEKTEYLLKVRFIRNNSIAHMGSNERKLPLIDILAALSWQPMTWGTTDAKWDLDELSFGDFRWRARTPGAAQPESRDLRIGGIPELHRNCSRYLESYDSTCADFLRNLQKAVAAKNNQK